MSEQTPDVEALAEVLKADGWLGHDDELEMYDLGNIAATILASDWLAAREQAAERRGAAKALRDEAEEFRQADRDGYLYLGDTTSRVPWMAVAQRLEASADRIEAGDD